jgi:hypothetical protein
MENDFIVAGRARNIPQILEVCKALRASGKRYYCFAENTHSHEKAGFDLNDHPDNLADDYEGRDLSSDSIRIIFEDDLAGLKSADNFLLVLPAGNSSHIEAGIAYGLGKKCYAIGNPDKTDSLYLIFTRIFADLDEFRHFLGK